SPALVGTPNPGRSQCNVAASVAHATKNPDDATGYIEASNAASNSGGCQKFNGLTTVQEYGTFGLNATGAIHLGPYARFHIGVDLKSDTRHILTAETRGDPTLTGNPKTVEPNSIDVNPLRRDVIDNVGRRYAIDDVISLTTYAHLILMF